MTTNLTFRFGQAGVARLDGLESIRTGGPRFASVGSSADRRTQGRQHRPWAGHDADLGVPTLVGMTAGRTPASGVAVRGAGMMQPR